MLIQSVNVAVPELVEHRGESVQTGIFKRPVSGAVHVSRLNLAGDQQADLKNHGGVHKAVYAYSADHYPFWSAELQRDDLGPGHFGENLTIQGLDEQQLCIGDILQVNSVELEVTQPRVPCYKLGIRFSDQDMPKRFTLAGRCGCYLAVLQEGELASGDPVTLIASSSGVSVGELFRRFFSPFDADTEILFYQALEQDALSDEWREHLQRRLKQKNSN